VTPCCPYCAEPLQHQDGRVSCRRCGLALPHVLRPHRRVKTLDDRVHETIEYAADLGRGRSCPYCHGPVRPQQIGDVWRYACTCGACGPSAGTQDAALAAWLAAWLGAGPVTDVARLLGRIQAIGYRLEQLAVTADHVAPADGVGDAIREIVNNIKEMCNATEPKK